MFFLVGVNALDLICAPDLDLGAMPAHVLRVLAVLAQAIRECRSHTALS
jgi:hypothetical protein